MNPATNRVLSMVKDAPRPRLADRGRLLGIDELQKILPPYKGEPRTRWWFNHSFLPEKRVRIGRDSAWWEMDVLAYLDGTMDSQ
jgi:hypothetical protein